MRVSWDDADGERDAPAAWSTVAELLRSLDGEDRTHVSIGDRDEHLVCGGSATSGLVLFVHVDGQTHQLLSGEAERADGSVELVAAGQPGVYPARFVVDIDRALAAAHTFVEESSADAAMEWE